MVLEMGAYHRGPLEVLGPVPARAVWPSTRSSSITGAAFSRAGAMESSTAFPPGSRAALLPPKNTASLKEMNT